MTTPLNSYSTGAVSVSSDGTTVTGTSTIWSSAGNVKPGDLFQSGHFLATITDVTDDTHLTITPWPGSTLSGAAYVVWKVSQQRIVGETYARDVDKLVGALNTSGFFVFVGTTETVPDPSLGDDGQYAFQPTTGKTWAKVAGVWTYLGIYKGFNFTGAYNGATTYSYGDVQTTSGSSYVYINASPSAGHTAPNTTYWQVLASIGATGATGPTGATGATGAPGGVTSIGGSTGVFTLSTGVTKVGNDLQVDGTVPRLAGSNTFTGVLTLTNATASTSRTTGALVITGGLGVSGSVFANVVNITNGGATSFALGSGTNTTNAAAKIFFSGAGTQYGLVLQAAGDNTTNVAFCNSTGSTIGSIGNTSGSATTFNTSSDRTLKTDERDLEDPSYVVMNTKVWDFAWKTTGKRSVGVFAQDAYEVCPDAISPPQGDGEHWQADYSKYVPYLIAHNQMLQGKLNEMEARLAALEA